MDGWVSVVTEPSEEPITVAEMKSHLRVSVTTDDTLIGAYISAARQDLEQRYYWRTLVTTTLDYSLQGWPSGDYIELPRPPLASVTSLKYTDSDGTETTVDSDDYHVDTVSTPGRLVLAYGKSWPTGTLQTSNPIVVRYVAGYGGASSVPEWAKWDLKVLVAMYYEHRESVVLAPGVVAVNLPHFYENLIGRRAW
jgi:uncharacterized phiE125 gp8 family phage protein